LVVLLAFGYIAEVEELSKTPGKTPRFSEELIQDCLLIMESGDIEDMFEIIPRIGVLRDPRFHKPLVDLLSQKDLKRCEFAAYAMGAMGDREFLDPLQRAFMEAQKAKGAGSQECLIAIIEAIGALGDDAAVDFFLPIFKSGDSSIQLRMMKWIIESLGAIAQQGGQRSVEALLEIAEHRNPELRAHAISEISVAYWHRPNEIEDSTLSRIHDMTRDDHPLVAESALAALQSLADVGCLRAEKLFHASSRV